MEELFSLFNERVDFLTAEVELSPVMLEDVLFLVVIQIIGYFVLHVLEDKLTLLRVVPEIIQLTITDI
mgnify:CR=1 FL=1